MPEKIITHPLRTITLHYDDAKPETPFEKQLLESYIALHNTAATLRQTCARLNYEFSELDDIITDAAKPFEPIAKNLNRFLKQAQTLTANRANKKEVEALVEVVNDYHETLTTFHQTVLNPLTAKAQPLWDEFMVFQDADEEFSMDIEKHENDFNDIFKNYANYSLDLVAYDDDMEAYKGELEKLEKLYKAYDKILERYNRLMNTITQSYAIWDKTHELFNLFHDEEGLLDNSQSLSYEQGTGDPAIKPLYMIEPGDQRIIDFRKSYGLMASSDRNKLFFSVPDEAVLSGDVSFIQQIVMALQHYPKMIDKWILSIDTQFLSPEGIPLQEDDWKGHEKYVRWFNRFLIMPCAIFFLEDRDARAYVLMGDLVSDNKIPTDGRGVALEGEMLEEVANRLFNACVFLMLYSHNTVFDPQYCIEAILADFDLPITYEQVKQEYEDYIKKGVEIKIVKKG